MMVQLRNLKASCCRKEQSSVHSSCWPNIYPSPFSTRTKICL